MAALTHPDVHQPWSQWSEDVTLHLVGVYSNPFRWRARRRNFNDFARHMLHTPNVKFYRVELAYGERPFEVTEPGDPLQIQLRTDCEMFHKENLINIGVQHLRARLEVWRVFRRRLPLYPARLGIGSDPHVATP